MEVLEADLEEGQAQAFQAVTLTRAKEEGSNNTNKIIKVLKAVQGLHQVIMQEEQSTNYPQFKTDNLLQGNNQTIMDLVLEVVHIMVIMWEAMVATIQVQDD